MITVNLSIILYTYIVQVCWKYIREKDRRGVFGTLSSAILQNDPIRHAKPKKTENATALNPLSTYSSS